MMKRVFLLLTLMTCLMLTACGVEKQSVEMNYGESQNIELKASEKDNLTWESEDAGIASVKNGIVTGMGPGSTVITAGKDGKKVAELNVTVNLVDISAVLFSQKSIELEVDTSAQLHYVLMPENASDYGLSWKSADTDVVEVDSAGNLRGIAPGTTTVILSSSSGAMDTCEVTVKAPSAIEQLNDDERLLFNYMTGSMLSGFYNASAVRIRGIYSSSVENDNALFVILDIQGTNRMGGTLFKKYGVFVNRKTKVGTYLECGENPDLSRPVDSSVMDLSKLNAALEEYWEDNHY